MSAPITGPERSVMTEADTTNAAVIAMRRPSVRMKMSSGNILHLRPGLRPDDVKSHPLHRDRNLRAVLDGLVDHAIPFGELQEQIELVLRRVGCNFEAQADFGKADRRFLVDAERAAEIEIAFGNDVAGLERHLDRG